KLLFKEKIPLECIHIIIRVRAMYDFIIVGAGSAGCVLANRLSANPAHRVCLIEAGGSDRNYLVRRTNPLNMLLLMNSKRFNWGYRCEPETRTGNRRFFWPRGKVLGGCSSVNAMIYARGHQWDFDHWAELGNDRSEEHTSELQSRENLVCRLLLEKKK